VYFDLQACGCVTMALMAVFTLTLVVAAVHDAVAIPRRSVMSFLRAVAIAIGVLVTSGVAWLLWLLWNLRDG